MRTAFRSFVLFAAIAALVATGGLSGPVAALQDKTDKKKAAEEVGTIEVYEAKDGWRFRVKNAEGKSLAISNGSYDTKEECVKTVESLKAVIGKAKVTEIKKEKDKKDK